MTKFKDNSKFAIKEIEIAIEKALTESALALEGNAKLRTPVRTGRLRQSISSRSSLLTGGKKGEADVGSNVEYAQHVEYGTKYQKAQPYLRTGAEASKKEIQHIFEKHLGFVDLKTDNI